MPYDCDLRQAYSELIHSRPWEFYSTITFRTPRHDQLSVISTLSKAFSRLEASRAFIAVEPHRMGGVHAHCLSHHPLRKDMQAGWIWKYMFKAFGRSSVSKIKDTQSLVTWYCAKYVTKGPDYEYGFMGNRDAWAEKDPETLALAYI